MLNNIKIIMMVAIFIMLVMVVFKPVKTAFNLGTFPSCLLSICVSALCVIGMSHFLKGSIEMILWPYTVMAIMILITLLLSFNGGHSKETKGRLSDHAVGKDDTTQIDKKNLRRIG